MKVEIIAEIGQNHNGDIDLAKQLIEKAKTNGADAAKFQVYDAKKLFPPKAENEWYDYNCKTELKKDQVIELSNFCKDINIEFIASVFDSSRVEWLELINVKRYKIASRSILDKYLIESVIKTKKPILISLGMWEDKKFPDFKCENKIDFLYCVSKYPTLLKDIKIKNVDFRVYSGFSDHTIGIDASCVAISRGAKIIEKHFTLDKKMYGPDHSCSMTPDELKKLNDFRTNYINMS
tara:strand:+ start:458 stop:1165 length:708 start_codon:yes stop_codon:yes gene_type:complete